MIEHIKTSGAAKVISGTVTAGASTVGVLTLFGITLGNWVSILTIIWFVILISKWFITDVVPLIKKYIFKGK